MKIAELPNHDKAELLQTVDRLRADIEADKIVGFAAVGINRQDETFAYTGATHVTRLRMIGALHNFTAAFTSGDFDAYWTNS